MPKLALPILLLVFTTQLQAHPFTFLQVSSIPATLEVNDSETGKTTIIKGRIIRPTFNPYPYVGALGCAYALIQILRRDPLQEALVIGGAAAAILATPFFLAQRFTHNVFFQPTGGITEGEVFGTLPRWTQIFSKSDGGWDLHIGPRRLRKLLRRIVLGNKIRERATGRQFYPERVRVVSDENFKITDVQIEGQSGDPVIGLERTFDIRELY